MGPGCGLMLANSNYTITSYTQRTFVLWSSPHYLKLLFEEVILTSLKIQNEWKEYSQIFLQTSPRHQCPLPRGKCVFNNLNIVFPEMFCSYTNGSVIYCRAPCFFNVLSSVFWWSFPISSQSHESWVCSFFLSALDTIICMDCYLCKLSLIDGVFMLFPFLFSFLFAISMNLQWITMFYIFVTIVSIPVE